jgi:hypothetical protein
MTQTNINLVWIILFRTLQSGLESIPTLLCGLFVAGLIRGMIGPDAVRRWFTDDPRVGPVRAWFTGMLLPVCSLGAIPIAWELRRAGVPRATVLTFLLTAPLADPFSLISAFQKMEGQGAFGLGVFVFLLVGSFIVLVGSGVLLGRWLPETVAPPDLSPLPASGLRRVGITFLTASRGLTGGLFPILVVGLFGSGLLAVASGGALERAARDQSWGAPWHMALISLPFYVPTAQGTSLILELLLQGVTVGSVFIFFLLGVGCNLGTLAWIARTFGIRVLIRAAPVVVGAGLIVGYALPFALVSRAPQAMLGRRLLEIESGGGVRTARIRALKTTVMNDMSEPQLFLIGAGCVLGGLVLTGLVARAVGQRGTVDYWMTRAVSQPSQDRVAGWNRQLSAPHLVLAGMALGLVTVGAGLFIYYPAPSDLLNEMDNIHVELVLAQRSDPLPRENLLRLATQWQRLQHKLAVGDLLRRGRFDPRLKAMSEELRIVLDKYRQAIVEQSEPEELAILCTEAHRAATRCREILERSRAPE